MRAPAVKPLANCLDDAGVAVQAQKAIRAEVDDLMAVDHDPPPRAGLLHGQVLEMSIGIGFLEFIEEPDERLRPRACASLFIGRSASMSSPRIQERQRLLCLWATSCRVFEPRTTAAMFFPIADRIEAQRALMS